MVLTEQKKKKMEEFFLNTLLDILKLGCLIKYSAVSNIEISLIYNFQWLCMLIVPGILFITLGLRCSTEHFTVEGSNIRINFIYS